MKAVSLVDMLRHRSSYSPNQLAYRFIESDKIAHELSYSEFHIRVCNLAERLSASTKVGDRVVVLLPPSLDYIIAFYACLEARLIAVPCYPIMSERGYNKIISIVSSSQPAVIVGSARNERELKALSSLANCELVYPTYDENVKTENVYTRGDIRGQDIAFLQYTSGSTASPKGVMVTHDNLTSNIQAIIETFEVKETSSACSWLPPYHDMGLIGGILTPLFAGIPVTLMSPFRFIQKPVRWMHAISKYKATISGGPNFAYALCASNVSNANPDELDLSSWELAFCGAEPINLRSLRAFGDVYNKQGFDTRAFLNCYGLAESTLLVSGERSGLEIYDGEKNSRVSCGKIINKHTVKIVDPKSFLEKPEGQEGEIWIHGGSVAKGYWGDQLKTDECFHGQINESTDSKHYLRTGDLGYLVDERLFVTGRIKDLMIIRGTNYYPQDIEAITEDSHEAINKGGVAAFQIESNGEDKIVIVAEVKKRIANSVNLEEVENIILKNVVKSYSVPVHEIILSKQGSVPKTTSGKVQRNTCKLEYLEGNIRQCIPETL